MGNDKRPWELSPPLFLLSPGVSPRLPKIFDSERSNSTFQNKPLAFDERLTLVGLWLEFSMATDTQTSKIKKIPP